MLENCRERKKKIKYKNYDGKVGKHKFQFNFYCL